MAPVGTRITPSCFKVSRLTSTLSWSMAAVARGGKLTAVDVAKPVREAADSARGIDERAKRG